MGEASVWEPRTILEIVSGTKRVTERLIAVEGQTLFTLSTFAYPIGTGSLQVYRQGADGSAIGCRILVPNYDFVEQTETSFSLVSAAVAGEVIFAEGFVGVEATVDVRDTDIYVTNYQSIRDYAGTETLLYALGTVTPNDGGQGFLNYVDGEAVGYYVDNNDTIIVPTGGNGSAAWLRTAYFLKSMFPNLSSPSGVNKTELDILDGANLTTAQLNYLYTVVAGIVSADRAVVVDASKDIGTFGTVTAASFVGNLVGDVTGDLTGSLGGSSNCDDGVTAVTQAQYDNSTKLATTEYVDRLKSVLHVREVKAQGTDAGDASNESYQNRVLNTVVKNTITGASLATGTGIITLPAGTYNFYGMSPAYTTAGHFTELYNITDLSSIGRGPHEYNVASQQTSAHVRLDQIVFAVETTLRMRTYTKNGRATDGLGHAMNSPGSSEIYSELYIERVK